MSDPTLKTALEMSDMDELLELVGRLELLPEFGLRNHTAIIARLALEADQLEAKARLVRSRAREASVRLLEACRGQWTAAEIEDATGYKPD